MQDNFIVAILKTFDNLESLFVELASKLAPWLAPLLSAVVVSKAMTHPPFEWNIYLAVLTGAAIELSGISSLSTVLMLWSYRSEQPDDKKPSPVPLVIAVLCALAYLFTALSLAVVLKVVTGLEMLAYGLFVLLALTSAVNLAIRQDHQKRVNSGPVKRQSVTRKTRANDRSKAAKKPVTDQSDDERKANLDRANEQRDLSIIERRERVRERLLDGVPQTVIADELGVSVSTVRRDKVELNGSVQR